MADWPGTLPQYLRVNGAAIGLPENRLRSPVEIGPAKVRSLVSLNVREVSGTMAMTTAEWKELETFVITGLDNGTGTFNFPDPANPGSTILVRFGDELPKAQAKSNGRWIVSIKLEELP